MGSLVTINEGQVITDSRKVAEVFEMEHRNVLAVIRNIYTAENSAVSQMFMESTFKSRQGKECPMYLMNRDGFSLLVMGFTGQKALEWKIKYITAFNEMEAKLRAVKVLSPAEQIAQGLLAAKQLLEEKDKQIAQLAEINEVNKPKVIFADAVASSESSILIGELAKILRQKGVNMGQNRLFEWLRANGYLIKSGSSKNMPTQRAMEQGWFKITEGSYINANGVNITTKTTKVTGKGQQYFVNKFASMEELI
jgi:anti-repressor protein